ncbi:mechanosensitive ion channel family protein [Proteiniclasticum ruminis]|uniref:mechanosensitive ion channel family protein n=1 Tax=Proteiniclasticum ruminis TaxID=398199 RepID=UPI0028AD65ED|nr:mechanosensitive ion channel domain-containing protein [Proteiniclasticum ruminis]
MFEKMEELLIEYGLKLLVFLVVLFAGWNLAKYSVRLLEKNLKKSKIDVSIHGFLLTMASFLLKFVVLITSARILGVPITTFIAMLSAAGLAVGLALKDSLSNFAAGILLLATRPFSVGDFIESSSVSGTVLSIQILYTALNTADNKRVMVPNNHLATSHIINYSIEPYRRVDKIYSVAYGTDVKKVKEILMNIAIANEKILEDRGVMLGVSKHNEYSVDFDLKVWVKREDYFEVSYGLNETVIQVFEEQSIKIPYPLREIRMQSEEKK